MFISITTRLLTIIWMFCLCDLRRESSVKITSPCESTFWWRNLRSWIIGGGGSFYGVLQNSKIIINGGGVQIKTGIRFSLYFFKVVKGIKRYNIQGIEIRSGAVPDSQERLTSLLFIQNLRVPFTKLSWSGFGRPGKFGAFPRTFSIGTRTDSFFSFLPFCLYNSAFLNYLMYHKI